MNGSTCESCVEKAVENGMVPLQQDGIEKVKAGIVSIEEILRTAQSEIELE